MECPRCEQDDVVACEIPEVGAHGWYCPECEALWVDGPVGASEFQQLESYLEERGLTFADVVDLPGT